MKTDKIQVGKVKKDHDLPRPASLQPSGPIRRPGQQAGRRGGLGQKRGLGFTGSSSTNDKDSGEASSGGGKNNDDFRDLLTKK